MHHLVRLWAHFPSAVEKQRKPEQRCTPRLKPTSTSPAFSALPMKMDGVRSTQYKCAPYCAWPRRELHRSVSSTTSRRAIAVQRGHQSRVDGQLCATKQWQTVCNNSQPSDVVGVRNSQDAGSCTLHCKSAPSQRSRTRCTMVATRIQGTATSARTEREREREEETPEEENAKQSGVNAGE